MSRCLAVFFALPFLVSCDLLPAVEFSIDVSPASIADSIPNQRCVFLVTVQNEDPPTPLTGPVHITATATGATVAVEHAWLRPGQVAEVTVIPQPLASATAQGMMPDEGRSVSATITAERDGIEHTVTVPIHVWSEEEDLVGVSAAEMRDLFIPWLAENRPELGITASTEWTGTIVTPHILVVTHYLYFSDDWEMHVYWHVMIPPYDWAYIELRRRFQETLPSLAFKIPSRSADPIEVVEIEPSDSLWR